MKYFLLISIVLSMFSCSKEKKASYEVDHNFNKLDDQQLLSETLGSSNISTLNLKENFSYVDFYNQLNTQLDRQPKFKDNVINNIISTISLSCSDKSIQLQIDIIQKLLKKDISNVQISKIFKEEEKLILKCDSLSNEYLSKIKRINKYIFTLSQEDILKNLDTIISIDHIINSKNNSNSIFSSFTPNEVRELINILSKTENLDQLREVIRIHKKISPLSQIERSQILRNAFENSSIEEIFNNSTIQSSTKFLMNYFELVDNINQSKLKKVITLLINKIETENQNITRFEDIEEVLEKIWSDYTSIFEILNSNKLMDKAFTIKEFNRINLIVEKVYELPLNRTSAENFFASLHGENKLLANFHAMRLKSNADRAQTSLATSEINFNNDGILTNLLKLRLNLYSRPQKVEHITEYCGFVNLIIYGKKELLFTYDLKTILSNKNALGCFEYKAQESNLSATQLLNDEKEKVIINLANISTSADLLIKAVDTDINISSEYYNGPTWYLPSNRNHKKRDNILAELDSKTSPIVADITLLNNDQKYFKKDKIRIFYNFDFKKSESPKTQIEYIGNNRLKKGFRGGNLSIKVKSSKSIVPSFISTGSEGEKGPDRIAPGLGINSSKIYEKIFSDTNMEFYNNLLYSEADLTFTNIDRFNLENLATYDFDIAINDEVTTKLHEDLCGKSNSNSEVCYIIGDKLSYMKLKNNELNSIDTKLKEEFNHAIRILKNENNVTKLLSESFQFPPQSDDAFGDILIFENGANGNPGLLNFEISQ